MTENLAVGIPRREEPIMRLVCANRPTAVANGQVNETKASDIELFLKLLSQMSTALCDLGYREESNGLAAVVTNLGERLAINRQNAPQNSASSSQRSGWPR